MLTEAKQLIEAEALLERHRGSMGFANPELRRVAGESFPRSLPGNFSKEQREYVWFMDGGKCMACEKHFALRETQCDHITRQIDGGQNVLENARTLCVPCHGDKTAAENRLHRLAKRAGEDLKAFLGDVLRARGNDSVPIIDVIELVDVFTPYCVVITPAMQNPRMSPRKIQISKDELDITVHMTFPMCVVDAPGGRAKKNLYNGVRLTKEGRTLLDFAHDSIRSRDVYSGGCPTADRILHGVRWARRDDDAESKDTNRVPHGVRWARRDDDAESDHANRILDGGRWARRDDDRSSDVQPNHTATDLDADCCMRCRSSKPTVHHVRCTKCTGMYCQACLIRLHGEDSITVESTGMWECPRCRGSCGPGCFENCGSTAIGSSSMTAGFRDAHDYIVHLRTGETPYQIEYRKKQYVWYNMISDA